MGAAPLQGRFQREHGPGMGTMAAVRGGSGAAEEQWAPAARGWDS